METGVLSILHFGVDFVCAWAMFGFFRSGSGGYENLLIYNFCAFALQMPLGTLLDLRRKAGGGRALVWTGLGVVLTVVGALVHPALLGLGNALFHVGGGMDVICRDFEREHHGRDLGIFVAPGAIGLYLGTRLGKTDTGLGTLLIAAAVMGALLALLWRRPKAERGTPQQKTGQGTHFLALCCFLVVALRSWVGLGVNFEWKAAYGFLAVLMTALGKALGGILAARFGISRTIRWSLLLAAGCYLLGENALCGMAAMLFFNMSMPVTLYLLAKQLPGMAGFSFGLLTFGLFLGFLPVYAGVELPVSGSVFGMAGSLISLALLTAAGKAVEHDRVSA